MPNVLPAISPTTRARRIPADANALHIELWRAELSADADIILTD
jgi:hypothetical protein